MPENFIQRAMGSHVWLSLGAREFGDDLPRLEELRQRWGGKESPGKVQVRGDQGWDTVPTRSLHLLTGWTPSQGATGSWCSRSLAGPQKS